MISDLITQKIHLRLTTKQFNKWAQKANTAIISRNVFRKSGLVIPSIYQIHLRLAFCYFQSYNNARVINEEQTGYRRGDLCHQSPTPG